MTLSKTELPRSHKLGVFRSVLAVKKNTFILFLSAMACLGSSAWAAKEDTIVLENGNLVTGEVKALEFGKLRYSTDSMGTVMIEWDEILRITSKLSFTVDTRSGDRYYGSIVPSTDDGSMLVRTSTGTHTLLMDDVVRIQRIKDTFLDRLDTYVNVGYSYTKGSDVSEFNLGAELVYRDVNSTTRLSAVSRISDDGEEQSKFNQTTLDHRIYRDRRRYWAGILGFEQNDELGLDYRLLVGGGIGKYLIQTNWHELSMDVGPALTYTENEDGSSGEELEAFLRTKYRIFDYDTPKTDLTTGLLVLPGITNSGEYRVNLDVTLRKEFIEDLFWDISFYYRYDSDTPEDEASDDYGIVTSVGWEL